jgi:hypothetical protein
MQILTLRRQPPSVAQQCGLCDVPLAKTPQNRLLAVLPDTRHEEAAICQQCSAGVRRLEEVFGPELLPPVRYDAEVDMAAATEGGWR